ncbi:MAG: ABC transporter permease, partial [Anaerolineae bacterium]
LARLFTMPTPRAAILGGKFFAILLTLAVQVSVLLFAGRLLFGIRWGQPATVALLTLGLVVAAAGFGVFLMSFVKTARQSGPVMGLTVTLTGLLGGLMPTGNPSQPGVFDRVSLFLPQGWAMRGWKLAVNRATLAEALLPIRGVGRRRTGAVCRWRVRLSAAVRLGGIVMRILDIALKDLAQIFRDKKSLLFLVLMPIVFTVFMGFAFRSSDEDPRLPVGWVDRDPDGTLGTPFARPGGSDRDHRLGAAGGRRSCSS